MTREKVAFRGIKMPTSGQTLLTGVGVATAGYDQASKTRAELNRLKQKGGVMPPPGVKMPEQKKVATLMGKLQEKTANANATNLAMAAVGALALGAGTTLMNEGIRAGIRGAGNIIRRQNQDKQFKQILQRNPDIAQKKELARRYFDLIMTYGPSLARDETAITDYLRRQLQYETSSIEFVRHLVDLESTVRDKLDKNTLAFRVGAGSVGSLEAMGRKALEQRYLGDGKGQKS